jgi:hypothetical protein
MLGTPGTRQAVDVNAERETNSLQFTESAPTPVIYLWKGKDEVL